MALVLVLDLVLVLGFSKTTSQLSLLGIVMTTVAVCPREHPGGSDDGLDG